MSQVAFELREALASGDDAFSGGSIHLADGKTLDVKEALDEGSGKIVLDPEPNFTPKMDEDARQAEYERAWSDERAIAALDAFPALKRTSIGESSAKGRSAKKDGDS